MSFDQEFIEEVNQLRRDPKKYANKIEGYLQYFDGKVLNLPGRKAGIQTHEGPKAYQEAVNYLRKKDPVEPLNPSRALFRVAQDYIKKIQRKNADSSAVDIDALIDKYGTYYGDFINATDYGGQTPEQSIINLIVSDGDFNRVQREQLLSTSYKLIGGSTGTHPIFKFCTCIFMCSEFENKKDKEDIGFLDGSSYNQGSKPQAKAQPQSKSQPKWLSPKKEEPKTQSRYQPKWQSPTKEEPKTQSRYQPKWQSPKKEEPKTQSRYQPKWQSPKNEEPKTQSRYQPKWQSSKKEEEPETQSKYQPKFSYKKEEPKYQPKFSYKKEEPQTQSKYQPKYQSKYQPQKKDEPLTQSRYQSKYQTQKKYEPLTKSTKFESKYEITKKEEPTQSRYQSKYQSQNRSQPQAKYQPRTVREETTYQTTKKFTPTTLEEQLKSSSNKGKKVIKENSETKIVMEGGKRIMETKITRIYADGSKDEETLIEEE